MSHGGHPHGGMNEHSTMATHMHHSTEHHGGQDSHGGHGETGGHVMMFHLRRDLVLLFEQWDISSTKVLVASCIGVLLVSLLYEGLKIFRAKLMQMHRMEKQAGQGNGVVKISGVCRDCRTNICNIHHLSQTVLHVVQVVVGYLLMLVVMTFQVYLGLAVVIGAGLGYFFFAGLISETDSSMPQSCPNPTTVSPELILNVMNFKDLENNQYEPRKLSISDLASENKGYAT